MANAVYLRATSFLVVKAEDLVRAGIIFDVVLGDLAVEFFCRGGGDTLQSLQELRADTIARVFQEHCK